MKTTHSNRKGCKQLVVCGTKSTKRRDGRRASPPGLYFPPCISGVDNMEGGFTQPIQLVLGIVDRIVNLKRENIHANPQLCFALPK